MDTKAQDTLLLIIEDLLFRVDDGEVIVKGSEDMVRSLVS